MANRLIGSFTESLARSGQIWQHREPTHTEIIHWKPISSIRRTDRAEEDPEIDWGICMLLDGQLLARLQVSWDPIGPKSECPKKSGASTAMTNPLLHYGTALYVQANSMCIKILLPVCEFYALTLPQMFQFTIRRFCYLA